MASKHTTLERPHLGEVGADTRRSGHQSRSPGHLSVPSNHEARGPGALDGGMPIGRVPDHREVKLPSPKCEPNQSEAREYHAIGCRRLKLDCTDRERGTSRRGGHCTHQHINQTQRRGGHQSRIFNTDEHALAFACAAPHCCCLFGVVRLAGPGRSCHATLSALWMWMWSVDVECGCGVPLNELWSFANRLWISANKPVDSEERVVEQQEEVVDTQEASCGTKGTRAWKRV
jgi:hypothetical protein